MQDPLIGLRRRSCMGNMFIGYPCSLADTDLRLPRQEKTFTVPDIDSFTFATRLRNMKLISGAASLLLLLDVIVKIYEGYTVSIEIVGCIFCLVLTIALQIGDGKWTHAHVAQIAGAAYLLAVLAYASLTVLFTSRLKTAQADLERCYMTSSELRIRTCAQMATDIKGLWGVYQYHDLMVFAVSYGLVSFIPVPPLIVFVGQLGTMLVILTHYLWDYVSILSTGHQVAQLSQIGGLVLLPRLLLSFGCVCFTLHQHRLLRIVQFLQIIVDQEDSTAGPSVTGVDNDKELVV